MFWAGCIIGGLIGYVVLGYFFLAWLANLLGRAEI